MHGWGTNEVMPATEVSKELSGWIASCKLDQIPATVRAEGTRSFINWLGCAVGGSNHAAVGRALAAVRPFSGAPQATVIALGERLDAMHAALINGIGSHVLDYDDTHLNTIIHPAGPVASAALAVAEMNSLSGADLLASIVIGIEVECRIGNAVCPEHYGAGWHVTGTAGVFGAAAAVAHLLHLGHRETNWALGIAATQSSGLQEMFATMTKSFHVGSAAKNGILSALLAKAGFESSERSIEAPRGFAKVLSSKQDFLQITDGLGERWEAARNTYKPFSCGIVLHPTIDACIQIRRQRPISLSDIAAVEVRANPLVLKLAGNPGPENEYQAKLSVFHAAAVALLRGDGSPAAFFDTAVHDPEIATLRNRVRVVSDASLGKAAAEVFVGFADGTKITQSIKFAIGSAERPLTDHELDKKFNGQAEAILGASACARLRDLAWNLESIPDSNILAKVSAQVSKRG